MKFINDNELFLLWEIIKRNFSSKYKDSTLGILWSVLSPLLMMILFTIIFSTIFSRNIENFPVYFLSGRCCYDFFSGCIRVSMNSIKGNKNIIQKVPVSKYVFILGSIISEFFNFIISIIILMGVMIVTRAPFYLTIMPLSIIPIISLLIMVTGLGLVFSIACVYYTDINYLWGVCSQMIMYASAIFYPMSIIPEPYRQYLILNPIFWIIDQFRCFVYYGSIPSIHYVLNSLLLSSIILVFGVIIFKKYETRVIMRF